MVHTQKSRGAALLPLILAFSFVMVVVGIAFTSIGFSHAVAIQAEYQGSQALHFAEAGINDALQRIVRNRDYLCESDDCYTIPFATDGCTSASQCASVTVMPHATSTVLRVITSRGQSGTSVRTLRRIVSIDSANRGALKKPRWCEEYRDGAVGSCSRIDLVGLGVVDTVVHLESAVYGAPTLTVGDTFGGSLTTVGDLNGDDIPDIVIGAPGDDTGAVDAGAVYVLFMNTDGSVQSYTQIASSLNGGPLLTNGDAFGTDIEGVGDINRDGIDDIAVSAQGGGAGAVYVLFMNTDGSVQSYTQIASNLNGGPLLTATDGFGEGLGFAGDIDEDGMYEIVVGAPGNDTGGTNRGAVYVLSLNTDGSVASTTFLANNIHGAPTLADTEAFGTALSVVDDLNGDAIPDIVVGAPGNDTGGTNRGAVYILFMNSDKTVQSYTYLADGISNMPTLSDTEAFGTSVATIGDVNKDTIPDIVVGAPGNDTGGTNRGAVYVLFMNTDGSVQSYTQIAGNSVSLNDDNTFGSAVTGAIDLNFDSIPDIAVGLPGVTTGATKIIFLK